MEQSEGMVKVTLKGVSYSCAKGTRLGELLRRVGQGHSPCGGHGSCGKCRVILKGEVSPPTEEELRMLSSEELAVGVRLSCRVRVKGNCTVTVLAPMEGQICTGGDFPPSVARRRSRLSSEGCGVAVDVGTTTLAARLYNARGELLSESSRLNPQSPWGADVISRMEAAMRGGGGRLVGVLRRALDGMLTELTHKAQVSPTDIEEVVVTGNTVMLHLLTETEVEPLTHAPFAVQRLFDETLTARELCLTTLSPKAPIYLPPCVSAFLGADVVTALLASDLWELPETALLCDIGTNGEMVLRRGDTLYACSAAAGPAFEGAGISMGMGGVKGAIDRVWEQEQTLCAHVIGETAPLGLCGSGLVDAVATLLRMGRLERSGYLKEDPVTIAPPVTLSQEDIRKVQLAKGAICAGIRSLLHAAGTEADRVSTLYVAGGFGSYLDVGHAGEIGLIPLELTHRVRVLGNGALTGAAMLLLYEGLRSRCRAMVEATRVVELATDPVFAQAYMEELGF